MREINLVLSGSGVRFPYFVGALKAIEEVGLRVRRLVGTSGGALVGTAYKTGISLRNIERLAIESDYESIASWHPGKLALLPVRGYINSGARYRRLLGALMGDRTFASVPDFAAVVTNLSKSETVICHAGTTPELALVDGVYASGAIPIVFEPHWHEGDVWVDGTVSDDFAIDWRALRNGLLTVGINLGLEHGPLTPSSAIDVIRVSISNLISAADRKRIEDAPPHAIISNIPLPIDPLDFAIRPAKKRELVERGYLDTLRLLSVNEVVGFGGGGHDAQPGLQ